jgi:diaminopimelate epimerase
MRKTVPFEKIHSCGNDFLLLETPLARPEVVSICHRQYGLGADGLLLYQESSQQKALFHYDADGSMSFCLNGTRAALWVLAQKGLIPNRGTIASQGMTIPYDLNSSQGVDPRFSPRVYLEKRLPRPITLPLQEETLEGFFVDVGNPQLILFRSSKEEISRELAKSLRYHAYFPEGSNVNWIAKDEDEVWQIESYERGVEDFTLACGSGILAAACVLFSQTRKASFVFSPKGQGYLVMRAAGPLIQMEGPVAWVGSGTFFFS